MPQINDEEVTACNERHASLVVTIVNYGHQKFIELILVKMADDAPTSFQLLSICEFEILFYRQD
jgi:hypothetical protein